MVSYDFCYEQAKIFPSGRAKLPLKSEETLNRIRPKRSPKKKMVAELKLNKHHTLSDLIIDWLKFSHAYRLPF